MKQRFSEQVLIRFKLFSRWSFGGSNMPKDVNDTLKPITLDSKLICHYFFYIHHFINWGTKPQWKTAERGCALYLSQ